MWTRAEELGGQGCSGWGVCALGVRLNSLRMTIRRTGGARPGFCHPRPCLPLYVSDLWDRCTDRHTGARVSLV